MIDNFKIICEAIANKRVPYIIHKHTPRSGSLHYDLRFGNPNNPKELFSFAAPKNFMETINQKTVLVRTKEHLYRWIDLKSYRLVDVEKGDVEVLLSTSKFFKLKFYGKLLKGNYKLFKIKTKRDDQWILISK